MTGMDSGRPAKMDIGALTSEGYVRTQWWWVRHAPVRDDGGRIYGQADPPCDCSERPVFERLASVLPRGAVWVASHLIRTRQTAEAIWAAGYTPDAPLRPVPALAEQDLGSWQGTDRAAFFRSRVSRPDSYWFAQADERAPGGESFVDVVDRVRHAVDGLTRELSGRHIVAVAHGGTIRAALAVALSLEPQRVLGVAVENCSITRLDHYDRGDAAGWRTVMVNHQPWMDGSGSSVPG